MKQKKKDNPRQISRFSPYGSKAKIVHSRSLTAPLEEDGVLDSGNYQLSSRKMFSVSYFI